MHQFLKILLFVTNENTYISYMDTQDTKFCFTIITNSSNSKSNFLSGLKGWVSSEIISLCEQLAGQTAKVQRVPLILLKFVSNFLVFRVGSKY
jgi:hypothetical protein